MLGDVFCKLETDNFISSGPRVLIVIHSHQTNFNAHRACLPMVTRWQARDSSWIAYTDDDPPVSANGICIDSFTYDDASKSLHRSNYVIFLL